MAIIEARIEQMGLQLPPVTPPKFSYIPSNRSGNLLFLSGQDCRINGVLMYEGKVGGGLTIEQGQAAARQTIINCLAVMKHELHDLDRVVKIVKLLGFVNSAPGFCEQPYVMNGASNLLIEIFGENGRHARSAVSANELPFNTPVEIEMIVEIRD